MPTAVVFDMDGVLLDSEPVHYSVLRSLLAAEGISWTLDDHEHSLGKTIEDTWDDLRARHGADAPVDGLAARYDSEMLARYGAGIAPIPGALGLLRRLASLNVPVAVASSSHRAWVDAGLQGSGIARYARHSVSGDEVAAGKPDPEIYLKAARGLGVPPSECIAVEDAMAGVASARAAGMAVVFLSAGEGPGVPPGPDRRIDDLTGFDLAWLDGRTA